LHVEINEQPNHRKKAWAFIGQKHLSETCGKVFLTLTATGLEKDRLRFRLKAGFGKLEDRYRFQGTVNPSRPKTINGWKILEVKS
jgi:hypothetical protein